MDNVAIKPELFLIAHRMNVGSPTERAFNHVDNGMEALEAFLQVSVSRNGLERINGFECDVRLTQDNVLVVLHDGNVKTMTKSKFNKKISDISYDELSRIKITNAEKYYNSLRSRALLLPDSKRVRTIISQRLQNTTIVPKAFEMFEYLAEKGYDKEIVLELKEASDKNRDATIELVNTYKSRLNIIVKSYDAERTITIGEKTGVKIGLLEAIKVVSKRKAIDENFIKNMPFDFYSLLWTKINIKKMSALIDNDKALYMWTIDSAAHLFAVLSLLEWFYDKLGILPQKTNLISNIPILLNEYLNNDIKNVPLTKSINQKYSKIFQTV